MGRVGSKPGHHTCKASVQLLSHILGPRFTTSTLFCKEKKFEGTEKSSLEAGPIHLCSPICGHILHLEKVLSFLVTPPLNPASSSERKPKLQRVPNVELAVPRLQE